MVLMPLDWAHGSILMEVGLELGLHPRRVARHVGYLYDGGGDVNRM